MVVVFMIEEDLKRSSASPVHSKTQGSYSITVIG